MLHPTVRLWVGGTAIVACQFLSLQLIGPVLAVGVLVALGCARQRLKRLAARSRWLFISLGVLFVFFTPGTAIAPALGTASPTLEGMHQAALHLSRLLAVIVVVALLLEVSRRDELVLGLYSLFRPLSNVGFDVQQAAIRLMLVLHYVDEPRGGTAWRDWLNADLDRTRALAVQPLSLIPVGWRMTDYLALGASVVLLALLALR